MKKSQNNSTENFHFFTAVENRCISHGRVFVMYNPYTSSISSLYPFSVDLQSVLCQTNSLIILKKRKKFQMLTRSGTRI